MLNLYLLNLFYINTSQFDVKIYLFCIIYIKLKFSIKFLNWVYKRFVYILCLQNIILK